MAAREYKKLEYGRSVFNPPREMTVGKAEIVTYRVVYGAETVTPTLIAEITPEPNRQIITSTVKIASRMKATLKGDGTAFSITPLHSTEEKMILPNEPNDWSWSVAPNESGPHTLILALTAVIEVGDKNIAYDLPIDRKTVNIRINWNLLAEDVVRNFWAQLIAILGFIATGIELAWRRINKTSAAGSLWRSVTSGRNANAPNPQERQPRRRRGGRQ
jgi:hypothetical protein